jgi:NAD(P)-dependent dehydrogenase (short-subunit alcohol dehydrogenase family)
VVATDLGRDLETVPYQLGSEDELEETRRQVEALGRRCLCRVGDVRDLGAMEEIVAQAARELGAVEIVCANAGVISFGPSWQLSEAQWDEVVDSNLKGAWLTCRATVPGMIQGGRGGCIVLTSSAAGLRGYSGFAHYVSAKHGVVGLMRSLAIELAPHRIRVNCLHPGGVRTPMGLSDAMQGQLAADPHANRALGALLPIDLVEPEDVSAAVVWLASDAARYVTGVSLPVDAGTLLI